MPIIEVIVADITQLRVDAIVNAANEALAGGGGVDGAIHRAAGPRLHAACMALPSLGGKVRCATGAARITPGFDLPAAHVIHTVGPVWRGGSHGEAALLASCYQTSLRLAAEHRLSRVAFPAISCGIFGYPPAAAATVAVTQVRAWAEDLPSAVIFCCFSDAMADTYRALL